MLRHWHIAGVTTLQSLFSVRQQAGCKEICICFLSSR